MQYILYNIYILQHIKMGKKCHKSADLNLINLNLNNYY